MAPTSMVKQQRSLMAYGQCTESEKLYKQAVLSQGGLCDATVNFSTYRNLQTYCRILRSWPHPYSI